LSSKFLTIVNGVKTLISAITSSAGNTDANKVVATGSDGKLSLSLMPSGVGAATLALTATEALSAGNFVNIWDDTGISKVRKADATNGRTANGFVLNAVAQDATAIITLQGLNSGLSGLVAGKKYYLAASGSVDDDAPSISGQIIQELGIATSATTINFEYDTAIVIV
jgi:hypothetical protein